MNKLDPMIALLFCLAAGLIVWGLCIAVPFLL